MQNVNYIFVLLLVVLLSCSTNESSSSVVIQKNVSVSYLNEQGKDLVDPDQSNRVSDKNVTMYYLKNGEAVKYFEGNLDNPDGIGVLPPSQTPSEYYALDFLVNTIPSQSQAITYVQFADGATDTLKVQYKNSENSSFSGVVVTKVWYNQELVVEEGEPRYFIVTK